MSEKDLNATTEAGIAADGEIPRPARPGVKDEDQLVSTAGGEIVNGLVADIADGDT